MVGWADDVPSAPVTQPAHAVIPSDTYVAKRIGTSVFCTIEGRLVCLHLKSDQSFLVTVSQEPLLLHVGTFRYQALLDGRGTETASQASVVRAFIEAFEHTSSISAESVIATSNPGAHVSDADHVGVELLLGTVGGPQVVARAANLFSSATAGDAATAASAAAPTSREPMADFVRRSSLMLAHREKLEAEARDRRSSSISLQQQEAYLWEASLNQTAAVRVKFLVFGTMHCVVLELKPCPSQANIREPMIWGIMMDMCRTVLAQRRTIERLQSTLALRTSRTAISPQRSGDGVTSATGSGRRAVQKRAFHHFPARHSAGNVSSDADGAASKRVEISSLAVGAPPPAGAPHSARRPRDGRPQSGTAREAAPGGQPVPPWRYTQTSAVLESTIEATPDGRSHRPKSSRPTSASTDFSFRTRYGADVLRRAAADEGEGEPGDQGSGSPRQAPPVDQYLLLHPTAPFSAARAKGMHRDRPQQAIAVKMLTLSPDAMYE